MTYPKQLTKEAEAALSPFLKEIEELPEGETLRWEDTPPRLDKFRYHLYSYLYLNSLKDYYRVKRISVKELLLQRKEGLSPKLLTEGKAVAFVKDYLLSEESEEAALRQVHKAIASSVLDFGDVEEVMEEWRRKVGSG